MNVAARESISHSTVAAPRGRLRRYSLFQLKDFALERGLVMLLIGLMAAFPQVSQLHGRRFLFDSGYDWVPNIVSNMMFAVFIVGGLLSVPAMASRDRTQGFHRFLFAKPVSITSYYSHQFLVQLAGFIGASALVILGFNLFAFAYPITGVLAASAVFAIGLGGIGFLFSTLLRNDWLWLLGSFAASGLLNQWVRVHHRVLTPLLLLLPPIRELRVVRELILGHPFSMFDLVWILVYGLTAFVAGLFVLRKRSIIA